MPANLHWCKIQPLNYNILGKVAWLRLQSMLPRKSFGRFAHCNTYRSDASGVSVADNAEVSFQFS